MADVVREKRDLVLSPGEYAYMQDASKGTIKTYVGPTVVTPSGQETPVVYAPSDGTFVRVEHIEDAVRKSPIAVEGFYLILLNPSVKGDQPMPASAQPAADLDLGRKVNIPGPVCFALWPGQAAQHVRGHHLRSNQYLLVRVYNEIEAKKNWGKAVIKAADGAEVAAVAEPPALTVGQQLIIRGTEVSFYIPPTGIAVVSAGEDDETGRTKYVRDALTLERLEYCILVDEDGNKRYEQGPAVVFPEPTEKFVTAGNDLKFRAIELNPIQGLHIKVIADYKEGDREYKTGEELFITGADTSIYYPREEHSAIKYDGRVKHFATAIPAGEARYVMNRMTGDIRMVVGPAMLLPDPRIEVIVRRVLSDNQVSLWYPGNIEALKYNQDLRNILASTPTTRAGVLSEGDILRSALGPTAKGTSGTRTGGGAAVGAVMAYSAPSMMDASMVSSEQDVAGDVFSRSATYTQPRSITLDTKYQGVPSVDVWTGYAVKVISKTGMRRVVKGPQTVQLAYDETFEIVELSTGKPKTTDKLLKTVYLRVENNNVSDIITLETSDHVKVKLYVSYRVSFLEEHQEKWFDVENYIKFLCDHARSVLKGAVRKLMIEEFYKNSTDIVRNIILGGKPDVAARPGMHFKENGMHVTDIEVLNVSIEDPAIQQLLDKAEIDVVRSNIALATAKRDLAVTTEQERINREKAEVIHTTAASKLKLESELAANQLALALARIASELQQKTETAAVVNASEKLKDIANTAELQRREAAFAIERTQQDARIALLKAETDAVIARFGAAQTGFSEALLALSHDETLKKVAEAWSLQRAIGGESVSDALARVFAGTPLANVVKKLTSNGGAVADAE